MSSVEHKSESTHFSAELRSITTNALTVVTPDRYQEIKEWLIKKCKQEAKSGKSSYAIVLDDDTEAIKSICRDLDLQYQVYTPYADGHVPCNNRHGWEPYVYRQYEQLLITW
jgi:hypothetical protein